MLDINKVYVVLHRDNTTGYVSGDNPRMKPFLATNAMIEYERGEPCLAYWAIGDVRGHLLEGSIIRQLPNGIVFNARHINETITLTEFTMQEFEQRCRPDMECMTPGSTRDLRTIADVYAFCRRTAPTIHQPEQEERPMKLTKADIDKVRHIEGFPIARDEDIISLSCAPYYTACPNPFIEDFIRENGTPYDEATDDYHREPFAADVSEGKNDPIYNAHSYHTKVPHKAIMRYILHYTKPGDIVFDGFSGTGMTGVAAQMCGNPEPAFRSLIEAEMPGVEWGVRNAIVNDLAPAATYIAGNHTLPFDYSAFIAEAERILKKVELEFGWMYETKVEGQVPTLFGNTDTVTISNTIWSSVLVCPSCSKDVVLYTYGVSKEGKVLSKFNCPHCNAEIVKTQAERKLETFYDEILGTTITRAVQVPVYKIYKYAGKKQMMPLSDYDYTVLKKIDAISLADKGIPTEKMMFRDGKWGDIHRSGYHLGYTHAHHFYTKRNLLVLNALYHEIEAVEDNRLRSMLLFALTGCMSRLNRTNKWLPSLQMAPGPISGMLYIPSLYPELNVFNGFRNKLDDIQRYYINSRFEKSSTMVTTQSSACLSNMQGSCVDYIFVDPPFGDNIMYSESNFLWEVWLKVYTNNKDEAIINSTQKKSLVEYQDLIERCFSEFYRVLKPNRWITIEFHNSQNSVWNAIQEALMRVGFIIADVRVLNKQQGSFKQVTTHGAVKQDLVISAYRPKESFVREFQARAGDPEMAWEFVRQHLRNVPITADGNRDGKLDMIAERQDYLLFDRMVAWHIMNGIPVPMDAHTFYDGLRQRFLERDGMFFLPDQVTEYDDKRAHMELDVQQMSFLVTDEKNAIAWLNYILAQGPKTYQEIQPLYLQELHQSKQEKMPELLDMLRENFVQDEKGAWYIPDLNNAADLAKVRRKALLKEFYDSCVPGKGKLKVFRMEAIRAGFDECWKQRDFATIVSVGERLPEAALQEDQTLLMYYDNACSRV